MQRDPENRERQFIAEMIGPQPGATLEVGCGDGRLTAPIAQTCRTLIAIEPDLSLLKEARGSVPGSVRFLSGTGEYLPLTDGCVETVVFSLSLHHLNAPRGLAEAGRVLNRRGRILVMEPVQDSLMTRLFSFAHDESVEYAQTETAVRKSCFKVIQSGFIQTRWIFEDFMEMAGYVLGYYGLPTGPGVELGMAELLGKRSTLKPLSIDDITRYWLLAK